MKSLTLLKPIASIVGLFLLLCTYSCQKKGSISTDTFIEKPIGQMAPLDMVFIPGEGQLPSFYVGVSEEPNINYLIYLRWIKTTYGDSWPEVVADALPNKIKQTSLFKYNDPYIDSYLTHPSFSYYPVTGLSWVQIQNYLQWKSNRLNEMILVNNGILNFNMEQRDEDTFNTEAYLFGQYEGSIRKNITDRKGNERIVDFSDGILFPGFRLPTEAEWEHINQPKFKKPIDPNACLNPLSNKAINTPYGKDYFTLAWSVLFDYSYYQNVRRDQELFLDKSFDYEIINVMGPREAHFDYQPDESDKNGAPKRLTSIGDFDERVAGVANMEGNVREWVMDLYEEEFDDSLRDPIVIMKKSGFAIEDAAEVDIKGGLVEKDYLGRMKNFRIMGVLTDGNLLEVETHLVHSTLNYKNKHRRLLIRKNKVIRDLQRLESHPEKVKKEVELNSAKIEVLEHLIGHKKSHEEVMRILNHELYFEYKDLSKLNKAKIKNELQEKVYRYNPLLAKSKLTEIEEQLTILDQSLDHKLQKKRVVKGGTWQNPGNQRSGLAETDADIEVGFRCVLPYTGLPVENQYKVNWKR